MAGKLSGWSNRKSLRASMLAATCGGLAAKGIAQSCCRISPCSGSNRTGHELIVQEVFTWTGPCHFGEFFVLTLDNDRALKDHGMIVNCFRGMYKNVVTHGVSKKMIALGTYEELHNKSTPYSGQRKAVS